MDIIIKTKFEIGDKVTVEHSGEAYTTNSSWAKEKEMHRYAYNESLSCGDKGEVVAIGLHGSYTIVMYGIRVGEKEFIIGEIGLGNSI